MSEDEGELCSSPTTSTLTFRTRRQLASAAGTLIAHEKEEEEDEEEDDDADDAVGELSIAMRGCNHMR